MNLQSKIEIVLLIIVILVGLAVCGGAWGPSDLELFQRAAEPFNL